METASTAADPRFARLKGALFSQPLPGELQLIVLTAVEQDDGAAIELIDPNLTNADDATGLVVVYYLYPPGTDADANFEEGLESLQGAPGDLVDLDVAEPTKCRVSPDGGYCITGADTYYIQSIYSPGENLDDMEELMTEIVDAAIAHYEQNA